MKNAFDFIQKALHSRDIQIFVFFSLFLSTFSRFKKTNESGIIFYVIFYIHKLVDITFGISKEPPASSNLVKSYLTNKEIFLNLFYNLKSNWSLVQVTFIFHNLIH